MGLSWKDSTSYLTPITSEWLKLKEKETNVSEDVEKKGRHALLTGMQTGATTVEDGVEMVELAYDPVMTLLGIYSKNIKH